MQSQEKLQTGFDPNNINMIGKIHIPKIDFYKMNQKQKLVYSQSESNILRNRATQSQSQGRKMKANSQMNNQNQFQVYQQQEQKQLIQKQPQLQERKQFIIKQQRIQQNPRQEQQWNYIQFQQQQQQQNDYFKNTAMTSPNFSQNNSNHIRNYSNQIFSPQVFNQTLMSGRSVQNKTLENLYEKFRSSNSLFLENEKILGSLNHVQITLKQNLDLQQLSQENIDQSLYSPFFDDKTLFLMFKTLEELDNQIVKEILNKEEGFKSKQLLLVTKILNENLDIPLRRMMEADRALGIFAQTLMKFITFFLEQVYTQFFSEKIQNLIHKATAESQTKIKNLEKEKLDQEVEIAKLQKQNQVLFEENVKNETKLKVEINSLQNEITDIKSNFENISSLDEADTSLRNINDNLMDLQKMIIHFEKNHQENGVLYNTAFAEIGDAILVKEQDIQSKMDIIKKQQKLFISPDKNSQTLWGDHIFASYLTFDKIVNKVYQKISYNKIEESLMNFWDSIQIEKVETSSFADSFVEYLFGEFKDIFQVSEFIFNLVENFNVKHTTEPGDLLVQFFSKIFGLLENDIPSPEISLQMLQFYQYILANKMLLQQQQQSQQPYQVQQQQQQSQGQTQQGQQQQQQSQQGNSENEVVENIFKRYELLTELDDNQNLENILAKFCTVQGDSPTSVLDTMRTKLKTLKFQNVNKRIPMLGILFSFIKEMSKYEDDNLKIQFFAYVEESHENRLDYEYLKQLSEKQLFVKPHHFIHYMIQRFWDHNKQTRRKIIRKQKIDKQGQDSLNMTDEQFRSIIYDVYLNLQKLRKLNVNVTQKKKIIDNKTKNTNHRKKSLEDNANISTYNSSQGKIKQQQCNNSQSGGKSKK